MKRENRRNMGVMGMVVSGGIGLIGALLGLDAALSFLTAETSVHQIKGLLEALVAILLLGAGFVGVLLSVGLFNAEDK